MPDALGQSGGVFRAALAQRVPDGDGAPGEEQDHFALKAQSGIAVLEEGEIGGAQDFLFRSETAEIFQKLHGAVLGVGIGSVRYAFFEAEKQEGPAQKNNKKKKEDAHIASGCEIYRNNLYII